MKVLIVCSTSAGKVTSFVSEQAESLAQLYGVGFDYAEIKSGGIKGYLSGYVSFLKKVMSGRYQLVHAHYGLSGFIAGLQFFKPVVVTFHGCDVNDPKTRWISRWAYFFSKKSIFVEKEMPLKLHAQKKTTIIPCGVNIDIFKPQDKESARKLLGYDVTDRLVLFSSGFDVPVKNYRLAKAACDLVPGIKLIELKNYSRAQVSLLLNASDLLLLTSLREGSPQIVKEAMACNCPVVSTNVGDVSDLLNGVTNSFVCAADEKLIADKMSFILSTNERTNGRDKLIKDDLDLDAVAKRIHQVYLNILK